MSSQTVDVLRSELERLFTLEEMTSVAGLVGLGRDAAAQTTKASLARSLAEQCVNGEAVEALVDVVLQMRREVNPKLRDVAQLLGEAELAPGKPFGPYTIDKKLSATEMGVVYIAKKDGAAYMLKTLRREASRDHRAVHRFLTQNRLVATVKHEGLPKNIDAGEIDGTFYVAYENIDAQPLSARFSRTGPSHINELRPILKATLEPLAALHKAHLTHGDLKMDHVLIMRGPSGTGAAGDAQAMKAVLIDFGGDRLRPRLTPTSGQYGLLAVYGSPKTIAPEQVRGKSADAKTDVYAFGAMLYELLSGKPVFPVDNGAADAAMAHLSKPPEAPSAKAPRGWVSKDVDTFVLSLLAKDPAQRPKDAGALLEVIESLGKPTAAKTPATLMPQEKVDELVDALVAAPNDAEAAIALEKAVDQVAEPMKIADAFAIAADQIEAKGDDDKETKKSLLYRAARIFDSHKDKARAEDMYSLICELDPEDDVASIALETIRKSLGKFDEIVEMLLARADKAKSPADRARIMAEIGHTYSSELNDPDQALVAYTQALTEQPSVQEVVAEVERLAGGKAQHWSEVLGSITEAVKNPSIATADKNALLALLGRWYEAKLGRADTALQAYQQLLVTEPSSELALEGLSHIYRKAQQWPELQTTLLSHADAMGATPRARDLRVEAAEIFETRLNDPKRAKEIYATVISEDPAHARAGDALAKIAEKDGDWKTVVTLLDKRAEARRGTERAEVLARIAEIYEDQLSDLPEATRRYEAVLAVEPDHLVALKGLDRIFNRTGRYRELLENLEKQVAVAATPRQKINLYERMAGLYEEEFVDHTKASECLEGILTLDPSNDNALTALARHYRAAGKWEEVIKVFERHAAATHDDGRRVELMLSRARTLAEQVGSPERATKAFEQVLEIQPGNSGALESLARLREMSGDANAALSAIEALAQKALTSEAKAEQWMRAAKLLETRGDRDGAISRYKLALEANPKDGNASAALRAAYATRGDTISVVELIEKSLQYAESNLAKARLHAELAKLWQKQLRDDTKASTAAKLAFELDPNNPDAQLVLGDVAYEGQRYLEATKYYETLVGRTTALPKEDGVRVLLRYIEATGKLSVPMSQMPQGSSPDLTPFTATTSVKSSINPRVLVAVEALEKLEHTDQDTALRAAKAVFEFGDSATAQKMYADVFEKFGSKIVGQERAEALYGLGEAARRTGDLDGAIKPLREAAEADPASPRPLRALARVYEAKEDFKEAVRIRRRRLEMAVGQERFELLLEIGDIESQKLNDRATAAKTYGTALEEKPDDRKLLTRLMQLYSEEKDWRKLVEVVLRLADFVDDPKQRAKYMQTAAIVSARQIGDVDAALTYYDRAIEHDPSLSKAVEEALEISRQKGDHDGTERYLKLQLEQAKQANDRAAITRILDQLGNLYQKFLNEPEMAIDAFEAAQAFDPDNKERGETLAELYASDAPQYLDKAVKAQAGILRRNPYRVESYKLLRRLYTEAQRGDAAWCLCQALAVLNLAEPDEESFYRRHRADNAAPAQAVMSDDDWRKLAHPDQDAILTAIFAMIQPTIIRTRTQPLEALGYDRRYAIDPALHPYPVSQTLYYVQGVLGAQGPNAPLVFQNPNDPSGLGFIHAHSPAIVLGRAAFEAQVPTQSMAFVAGRHLTYYRAGYYVRHLVSTGTGLKAWLFAAIKTCVPQFPVSTDMSGPTDEAMTAMKPDFQGAQKERLASLVSKLIQTGAALDLKKWTASIDLTADRIGFLLAHDLQLATEVIRATEEGASVPGKERVKEVVLFSVSEEYFEIRQKLGIAIE